jgi:hypothetical protein
MAIKVISNQLHTTQVRDGIFLSKKEPSFRQARRNRSVRQFFLKLNPQNWFREFSNIEITMEEFQHPKPRSKKE